MYTFAKILRAVTDSTLSHIHLVPFISDCQYGVDTKILHTLLLLSDSSTTLMAGLTAAKPSQLVSMWQLCMLWPCSLGDLPLAPHAPAHLLGLPCLFPVP